MFTADHNVLCVLVKGVEPNCSVLHNDISVVSMSIRISIGLGIRFQRCSPNMGVATLKAKSHNYVVHYLISNPMWTE